ncbi:MAG: hypothetical protein KF868_10515 [Acidobacteria bacterium]|nr:hypothetical protein [Acidobacteriota bacterium]
MTGRIITGFEHLGIQMKMTPPCTYAEWLPLLDRFRAGDDEVLEALKLGTIEWTNVVAERWVQQVADSLNARLQMLSKQLQTGLDRARGDSFAISNTMLLVRRGLLPLRIFVCIPSLTPEVRAHLESELNRWTVETQKSLERHAEEFRQDQGRLLKIIRDHSLTIVVEPLPSTPSSSEDSTPPVRGRRVIL